MPYLRVYQKGNSDKKLRVWLQAAVHGNEPAGDQALLAVLGAMDMNTTWAKSLLDKIDLFVLPRYNPDGVFYFQRTLASNFDPNRDHVKLERQQTRDIKGLFNDFDPHIAIDMHEYSASRRYGNYVHASDGLFSAAKNLNIHPAIRDLSEGIFAGNIALAMEERRLRWEPYVQSEVKPSTSPGREMVFAEAGSGARLGRNAMGLTQCVAFLTETRGIGLADQEFQRRTASGLTMVTSILQTAADNAEYVRSTIEDARADFVDSKDDIVVTDYSELTNRTFTMVDVKNGSIVQVPIRFRPSTPTLANFTRTRPHSYIIPGAWADVADRLQASGLELQELRKDWTGTVEALRVMSVTLDNEYSEGAVLATIMTSMSVKEVTLPGGGFVVRTRQKNAALAMVALEPEGVDSYASTNIIPLEAGDEYPIYRR